jgi:Hemerythrin HHE cation binding domain
MGRAPVCECCGCRQITTIAELYREHEDVAAQVVLLRSALADGCLEDVAACCRQILAILGPHRVVEEGGLFPQVADEFPDLIEVPRSDHREIEKVLGEAADGPLMIRAGRPPCWTSFACWASTSSNRTAFFRRRRSRSTRTSGSASRLCEPGSLRGQEHQKQPVRSWMIRSPRQWSAPPGSAPRSRSPWTRARGGAAAGARPTLPTMTVLAAHVGWISVQPERACHPGRSPVGAASWRGSPRSVRVLGSDPAVSLDARAIRPKVVSLLDELGFAAGADARVRVVKLRPCPLRDAAHRNPPAVCSVRLGPVRGASDEPGVDPDRTKRTAPQPFSGSRGLPSGPAFSLPDHPVIRRSFLPVPTGVATPARPDAVSMLRARTAGKGISPLVAGWLLAVCVCCVAGATWAALGVATHNAAHDAIIDLGILGFTLVMITATAAAFPIVCAVVTFGARTRTVFSS